MMRVIEDRIISLILYRKIQGFICYSWQDAADMRQNLNARIIASKMLINIKKFW